MNTQHTGNTKMQPCPIARRRRKTIARQTMGSVGMREVNQLAPESDCR